MHYEPTRTPHHVFDSEAEYHEYLQHFDVQLPPDAIEIVEDDGQDEFDSLEVTENYPFAPEPW